MLLGGVLAVVPVEEQGQVSLPALHSGGRYVSPIQPQQDDSVPWAAGGSGSFSQFFRPHVQFSLPPAARPVQSGSGGRDPRRRQQPPKNKG